MAIFINDLFDFFWLYIVPGNVLDVVVIPLRLQLPKLHRLKLAQEIAGFEAPTFWVRAVRPVLLNSMVKPYACEAVVAMPCPSGGRSYAMPRSLHER